MPAIPVDHELVNEGPMSEQPLFQDTDEQEAAYASGARLERMTGGVDTDDAEVGLGAATGLTEGASGGIMTAPGAAPAAMADASEDNDGSIGRDR